MSEGMFDDVWGHEKNIIRDPHGALLRGGSVYRSFVFGNKRPFSVGWWKKFDNRLVRVAEWHGSTMRKEEGLRLDPKDIARGIRRRENMWNVLPIKGIADTSCFFASPGSVSVADVMAREGVPWEPASTDAGSRKAGWLMMREAIDSGYLAVSNQCWDFLRTVPCVPRGKSHPDDIDPDASGVVAEESRQLIYDLSKSSA